MGPWGPDPARRASTSWNSVAVPIGYARLTEMPVPASSTRSVSLNPPSAN